MAIRAVIFDFGGVLVRTMDLSGRRKWETRFGLADWELARAVFDSEASRLAQLGQGPPEAIWQHVAELYQLDARQLDDLQRDFWLGDQLDQALVRFLCGLRPRYKTAILSNAWSNAREVFVQKYGLGDAVDLMVISAEEGVMKPVPQIYQITLERLAVRPEEAVFVDDMERNVEGARAVGMWAVQFKDTEQTLTELREYLSR
jgi:epoxide hydrolase-like predicted phosphatase